MLGFFRLEFSKEFHVETVMRQYQLTPSNNQVSSMHIYFLKESAHNFEIINWIYLHHTLLSLGSLSKHIETLRFINIKFLNMTLHTQEHLP